MEFLANKYATLRLTRKDFILLLGSVLLTILGIPTIIKALSKGVPSKHVAIKNDKPTKFGSSSYGV